MVRVPYDVTHVRPSRPIPRRARRSVGQQEPPPKPGSFADRVASRRVNLVDVIEQGLPPLDFLPASDEMFIRGKRHMIAAPAKAGKSIGVLVHAVDMVLAQAKVAILDRENGHGLYARRLADIFDARKLGPAERETVGTALAYYDFPSLKRQDADALVEHFESFDLVVFDSQRMYLSDLGLKESESDDYAAFMSALVEPLFRNDVATLILDNTGHNDRTRGRGTSAKLDLNEILFSLDTTQEFDRFREGRMTLKVERSRFGNTGAWSLSIGGGTYGSWISGGGGEVRGEVRDAAIAVLREQAKPMGQAKLIDAVRNRGVRLGTDTGRDLLKRYADDPSCPIFHTADGFCLAAEAVRGAQDEPAPSYEAQAQAGPDEA